MTEEVIHKIREWQKKTGSVVFVDGSFQYTKWNQPHFEHTASLDHDLTFRVVCPTKALAIHGYRFSYAIVPETERELFTYLYENMCGSTPLRNLLFAQQAMTVLGSNTSNKKILNEIEMSFNLLMKRGAITPVGTPDCGYFIFAKLKESMRNIIAMDESYFELSGYPEYVRVNLIAPNILDAFS